MMNDSVPKQDDQIDLDVDELVTFIAKEMIELVHKRYNGIVGLDGNKVCYLIAVGALSRIDLGQAVIQRMQEYLDLSKKAT